MGGFEDGVTGDVIDVAAGSDSDPTYLRGQGVTEIIAVQIQSRDHVEIVGTRQHLLQRNVGDRIFDHNSGAGFTHRNSAPWAAVNFLSAEILFRDVVTPIPKRTLGEFHDVALVDERYAPAIVLDGVRDGAVNQSHTAGSANRLNADADHDIIFFRRAYHLPKFSGFFPGAESNLREILRKFFGEKIQNLLRLCRPRGVFDSGVNVFGVFPEDNHVHLIRIFHRGGDTFEILNRPEADIKIE